MEQNNHKRLAFIGAGLGIIPFVNKAKQMGVETVAFARGKDSLSKDKVDIFVEENSFDIDFIAAKCKELHVSGIIAYSEFTAELVAKIAHKAGLPGNDVTSGFGARNKYVMRCRVQNLEKVKQPKFELYNEDHVYDLPVIVKAVDSSGKEGVCLAKTKDEFEKALVEAKECSSNGTALIEEFLEGGQEYSIECLAYNGGSQIVQYTEKDSAGAPHFVELGHHQPATLTEEEKNKINLATKDILKILGIRCGMAHLELKIIDGDVYFIEVGARYGGGHIADTLVALSTDFDYFKAAIEASFGEYVPREIHNVSYAGLYYYCKQNEKLMPLFDKADSAPWIFENNFEKHDLLDVESTSQAHNSGDIIYYSDSKISLDNFNIENQPIAVEINNFHDAYQLYWNHFRELGYEYSDEELDYRIKKSFEISHVIGVVHNRRIEAFLLLYCNHIDTLDAFICYGHVLEEYRGLGYFTSLFNKALEICKCKGFKSMSLYVAKTNIHAIDVYEHLGFKKTCNEILIDNKEEFEMRLFF